MSHVISFNKVNFRYSAKPVLEDLSFAVAERESLALVGNNGCGKSTTIHILCNLIPYYSGEVVIFNKRLSAKYVSYKSKFGIVLSNPYFVEDFTLVDYLKFVGKFQRVPKQELPKRIDDLLDLLNMSELSVALKNLSSGNRAKVSLATALIHNPEVLVLDEPFVNVDLKTVETITGVLKKIGEKKTILVTSHNLDLVSHLCDRFLIMEEGKISGSLQKKDFRSPEEMKTHIRGLLGKGPSADAPAWLG